MLGYGSYRSSYDDQTLGCLAWVVVLALCMLAVYWAETFNRVQIPMAHVRLVEMSGAPADSVEFIRHSSPSWIGGAPRDITFEYTVNGRHRSGRCTTQISSAMVCRSYDQ